MAADISVVDVSDRLYITDCFVFASADNERMVNSIVDEVEEKLREAGVKPVRREGVREGRWALLDYGQIVVHIQRAQEREFYGLDRLWMDCPLVPVEGVETWQRPANWDVEKETGEVESIDQIPLVKRDIDADEL